jgi:hypothetical protein
VNNFYATGSIFHSIVPCVALLYRRINGSKKERKLIEIVRSVAETSKGVTESLKVVAETSKGVTENKNVTEIEVNSEKNEVLKKFTN